jgi:hypothetical protein
MHRQSKWLRGAGRHAVAATLYVGLAVSPLVLADTPPPRALTIELAGAWQQRNTAQVPNEAPNTRFGIDDITGTGPYAAGRVTLDWPLSQRHRLRFMFAPLSVNETGSIGQPIVFEGETFEPGDLRVTYRFDSWRASYRYMFYDSPRWRWTGGAALKVRDAEIRLRQGEQNRVKHDTGVVPLLALEGEWYFAERWQVVLDFEGLAAPQGRAFDVAARLVRELGSDISVFGGVRLLDGGADNDDVYTFARFGYVNAGLTWRFR